MGSFLESIVNRSDVVVHLEIMELTVHAMVVRFEFPELIGPLLQFTLRGVVILRIVLPFVQSVGDLVFVRFQFNSQRIDSVNKVRIPADSKSFSKGTNPLIDEIAFS